MPLPSGAFRAGVIIDIPAVSDALRRLWSQGKFRSRTVALGIASEGVLVRQMDLDWMPPSDFAKALRYQVTDALPLPVDEANLDYHLLEELDVPVEQEGQTRHVARILLVAAARDVVDSFVQAVHSAGLQVVRADLLPFALIRASCPDRSPDGLLEAIIDIGADTVAVFPPTADQPELFRSVTAAAATAGIPAERITTLTPKAPLLGSGRPVGGAKLPGKASAADVAAQSVSMTIEGSYQQMPQLIANLERMPRAYLITSLSLSAGTTPGTFSTAITGDMFVMPPAKDPASPEGRSAATAQPASK